MIMLTFGLLTLFTQVGGLVWLLCFPLFGWLRPKIANSYLHFGISTLVFAGIYLIFNLWLIPMAARPLGRVPMPVFSDKTLYPLNIGTCLLNRHYVTPGLKKTAESAAWQMNQQFPGTAVRYLDANFPFFRYPLFPHLSHNDGRKLDLAFYYSDARIGKPVNAAPSVIGYGVCEAPLPGETNMPDECARKGFWQYNFMSRHVVGQQGKKDFIFDARRTRTLLKILVEKPEVALIFIEPHLKVRLGLMRYPKIAFHGCQAVRHDDHLHLQIR